jgi:adenine C2-methylase RlmN of 23S rRNA A2503 and tRNA A37
MDLSKLSQILQGEAKFRFKQVYQSLYQDYISDWQQISVLPLSLRERLIKECPLDIQGVIVKDKNDKRAEKALITFSDGISVEAVLIRHRDGRHTLCLSSQAGCALACSFCATGKAGFKRNLSAEEIEQQYLFWARHLVVENK